jgi:hypothetical protein
VRADIIDLFFIKTDPTFIDRLGARAPGLQARVVAKQCTVPSAWTVRTSVSLSWQEIARLIGVSEHPEDRRLNNLQKTVIA